ncbi:MAG TPA: oxygenase MpaB family protein [Bacteroidia bacterium]|nr:oxygenase MpaB family protein [Bacteroidia bacterium]
MLTTNEQKWDVDFLNAMSLKTDPYAEQVIKDIIADKGFAELRNLFTSLSNDQEEITKNASLPQAVITYFNAETTLPAWADENKIKIAQKAYARFAPQIALLLNFKALPLCYACKNGAKVLAATGRLTESNGNVSRAVRRLFETSQMVINVMSPGGLSPKGKGIVTVKKVRLYHAAIRTYLMYPHKGQEPWDMQKYGAPINQEEMAGTLMAFSALVIDGLNEIGAILTEEEKDAFIHCWNIVGHFIGLDASLYPTGYQSGWNLGIAIINKNKHESDDGKLLTKTLLDFSATFFAANIFDKLFFASLPQFFIEFFIKDVSKQTNADILKILDANKKLSSFSKLKGRLFIKIVSAVSKEEDEDALVRKLFSKVASKFLQGVIDQHLKTYNTAFYIPPSLKASWKMN